MPVETRLITFTDAEVVEALVNYCGAIGWSLPDSGIKQLILPDGADSKIAIELEGDVPQLGQRAWSWRCREVSVP